MSQGPLSVPRSGGVGAATPSHEHGPARAGRGGPAGKSFIAVLGEAGARRPPGAPAGVAPASSARIAPRPTPPPPVGGAVSGLVRDALAGERQLDRLMTAAARGKSFNANELLALQQLAFRYSQTVEIISRGVDRVVSGAKQTLGTQV